MARKKTTNFAESLPRSLEFGLQWEAQKEATALNKLKIQVEEKKIEHGMMQLKYDKAKSSWQAMEAIAGEEYTPKQTEALVNMFKLFDPENEVDFMSLFSPIKDEKKDGVVTGYKFTTGKSMAQEYDNKLKDAQAKEAVANAALKGVEKTQREKLIYTDPADFFIGEAINAYEDIRNSPEWNKMTPDQRIDKLADIRRKLGARQATFPDVSEAAMGKIEQDMYRSLMEVESLKLIVESFDKTQFTIPGKLKAAAINAVLLAGDSAEKLADAMVGFGDEEKAYVSAMGTLRRAIGRQNASYVNRVSGAQFAVKELEWHLSNMFNPKNTYVAFMDAFNEYIDYVQKGYRIANLVKQTGLTGEALQAQIDSLLKIGYDETREPSNIDLVGDRFAEEYKKKNPNATEKEIEDATLLFLEKGGHFK